MEEDISTRTITILVILTVVVSILGTLSVMSAFSELKTAQKVQESGPAQGQVSLTITDRPVEQASAATGNIAFEITQTQEPQEQVEEQENRILLLPESNT